MMTAALSGCVGGPERAEPEARPTPAAPSGSPPARPSGGPAEALPGISGTPVVLEIEGQEIAGWLDGSPTAVSLAAQLPLTLSFDDHGGQEKYAELPMPLDLTGAPQRSDAEPLQIGYYVPDQRLILYYAYVGTFPGIVPIGSYGSSATIQDRTEEFSVTIREAE